MCELVDGVDDKGPAKPSGPATRAAYNVFSAYCEWVDRCLGLRRSKWIPALGLPD